MGPTPQAEKPAEEDETSNNESSSSSESDNEDWAYKAGKALGLSSKKPPLIDLEKLGAPSGKTFESKDEEIKFEFIEANKWIGIVMVIDDIKKFIWTYKKEQSENAMLFADIYDRDRRKAIKNKVERNLHVNSRQLEIDDYYLTTKGAIIAWIKTDPRMVAELHKRAARASLKDFKTSTYIPKIARDRQSSISKMLMDYKKVNNDFRFLIRNDEMDVKVLIKRFSEGSRLPYRMMSLDVLGAISPIKPRTKNSKDGAEDEKEDENPDGFTSPNRRGHRENYVPKEVIFQNITAILNGFEATAKINDARR